MSLLRLSACLAALTLLMSACSGSDTTSITEPTSSDAVATASPTPTPTPTPSATTSPTETGAEDATLSPATPAVTPTPTATAAASDAAAPSSGEVSTDTEGPIGTTFAYTGRNGELLEYAIETITDPATETVAANNYEVPPGQRYVFVSGTFTWIEGDYDSAAIFPSIGLSLIDDRGNSFGPVIAILDECQTYDDSKGLAPGDSIEGCLIYELGETTPIVAVEWTGGDQTNPLRWTL